MAVSATPTLKEVQQEITGNTTGNYSLLDALSHVGCSSPGNLAWFAGYTSFTIGNVSFITADETVFAESSNVTISWNAADCASTYLYQRWTGLNTTGTHDGAHETANTSCSYTFSDAYSYFGTEGSVNVLGKNGSMYGDVSCINFYLIRIPTQAYPLGFVPELPDDPAIFNWDGGRPYIDSYDIEINNNVNGSGTTLISTTVYTNSYNYGNSFGALGTFMSSDTISWRIRATGGTSTTDWTGWVTFSLY